MGVEVSVGFNMIRVTFNTKYLHVFHRPLHPLPTYRARLYACQKKEGTKRKERKKNDTKGTEWLNKEIER